MNGSCHCGNIGFTWELVGDAGALQPRACQCDFCRGYGAAYVSAVDSSLTYRIKDNTQLQIKKCGTETADFLVCALCNDLVLVTCSIDGVLYAVLNSHTLKNVSLKTPVPMVFGDEAVATKLARRKRNWIPNVRLTA